MRNERATRRIGIVGGMGPLATAAFHRLLVLNTAAARDQDHLHVIVESDPSIPDRTAFLVDGGDDPRPALTRVVRVLVEAGAELLVMPCNTANAFVEEFERAAGVPFVRWLETGVDAALATHSPSDGEVAVGLLATTGTLRAGLYTRLIRERGARPIEPDEAIQRGVMDAIYGPSGVKATGRVNDDGRDKLIAAARHLVAHGANVILLGCTELPIALPADHPDWPVTTVDPAVVVARRTILEAGGDLVPVAVTS